MATSLRDSWSAGVTSLRAPLPAAAAPRRGARRIRSWSRRSEVGAARRARTARPIARSTAVGATTPPSPRPSSTTDAHAPHRPVGRGDRRDRLRPAGEDVERHERAADRAEQHHAGEARTRSPAARCGSARSTATPSSTRQIENATTSGSERERRRRGRRQVEEHDARDQDHDELDDADRDPRERLADDDLERRRRRWRGAGPTSPQPCSAKNASVTSDTRKNALITAWPGTTCSAPVACGVPALHERGPQRGLEERDGDDREDDRAPAAASGSRRDQPELVRDDDADPPERAHAACRPRRRVVAPAGDREEHRLEARAGRPRSTGARAPSAPSCGSSGAAVRAGSSRRDPHRRPVDDRALAARDRGHRPVEGELERARPVPTDQLGERAARRRSDRGP